jgi:cytochrome c5
MTILEGGRIMVGRIARFAFILTSALFLATSAAPGQQGALVYAPQGWSDAERAAWYSITQGSRLMPLAWMEALERAEDAQPFLSPDNIDRFRYLSYPVAAGRRLPVGFAVDRQNDAGFVLTQLRWLPAQGPNEPWVGMTCSACHTTEIAAGARRLRIDGAPGLGDYQSFIHALNDAVAATLQDPAKWARFAAHILGAGTSAPNQARLRQALTLYADRRAHVAQMNGRPIDYGFGRVDAFGHIYNQASVFSGGPPPSPPNLSNAPVSYPFLWNVAQHDRVQWNGSVPNKRIGPLDVGALGRNTGEVIGVFGEVMTARPGLFQAFQGFPSSVNVANLAQLEQMLGRLRPPAWPEDLLGHIDPARAAHGAQIFRERCAACHTPLDRGDLHTPIVADMSYFAADAPARPGPWPNVQPGTDPVMACNAFFYTGDSGHLQGFDNQGGVIQAVDRIISMLTVTVTHALTAKAKDVVLAGIRFPADKLSPAVPPSLLRPLASTLPADPFPNLPDVYRRCVTRHWSGDGDRILGYKARPLTGIWATAPYLHNGSVPTLYDLLLPPARRLPQFYLGTRQYDPLHVGFLTEQSAENSFLFRTRDDQGNVIWGNFNGGHDYDNASLDSAGDRDRLDLLEYLKTL